MTEILFSFRKSTHILVVPSFLGTVTRGLAQGLEDELIILAANMSLICVSITALCGYDMAVDESGGGAVSGFYPQFYPQRF